MSQGDIVFILSEQEHATYIREKCDLICTIPVTLKDALLGPSFKITLLNGIFHPFF